MTDGGYQSNPGAIKPLRKPRDGNDLPEWKEELNSTQRKVRARVKHTLARMKCWKISATTGEPRTLSPPPRPESPFSATSPSPADHADHHATPNNKINPLAERWRASCWQATTCGCYLSEHVLA
jgi:hypothetical protein